MSNNYLHQAHSTPDPDLPPEPKPTPVPVPDDVPAPVNAPVEEPTFPEPPIKAAPALSRASGRFGGAGRCVGRA